MINNTMRKTPLIIHLILRILLLIVWIITVGGLSDLLHLHWIVAVLLFSAVIILWRRLSWSGWVSMAIVAGFAAMVLLVLRLEPSNDRQWPADKAVLPRIEFNGDIVTIHGFRDFKWYEGKKYDAEWKTASFDLRDLNRLELVVEPFKDSRLSAHTMLDFGFNDDRHVVVSVEARNEEGERYGLFPGALRQFELIYVFGEERDLLTLRAVQRGTNIYLYPIKTNQKFMEDLFVDLAKSANKLHSAPRFYKTLTDNCTTTLAKHIDHLRKERIGMRAGSIFPAQAGRLLYHLNYMDTDLPYEDARQYYKVDDTIRAFADNPDFSRLIRDNKMLPKDLGSL